MREPRGPPRDAVFLGKIEQRAIISVAELRNGGRIEPGGENAVP